MKTVHTFDNGIRVYREHLLSKQLERYAKTNLHEPEEEAIFLDEISGISTYLDVGAAIGYYAMLAKLSNSELEIHAVEPLEIHRKYFEENCKLNSLDFGSYFIYPVAVSEKDGEIEMIEMGYSSYVRPKKTMTNVLTEAVGLSHKTKKIVPALTLDSLVKRIGKEVDLCQMDVQGLEFSILNASQELLRTKRVKTFLVGTHSQEIHDNCKTLLVENGYRVKVDNFDSTDQPDGILLVSVNDK